METQKLSHEKLNICMALVLRVEAKVAKIAKVQKSLLLKEIIYHKMASNQIQRKKGHSNFKYERE